jgi:cathepsin A (carboxypeptidase C)
MKAVISSLLLLSIPLAAYGAPPAFDGIARPQTPFNLGKFSAEQFRDSATEWLDDAMKNVLQGKKNMEKWFHQGREYIKQDNLLCEVISAHRLFRF